MVLRCTAQKLEFTLLFTNHILLSFFILLKKVLFDIYFIPQVYSTLRDS